MDRTVAGLFPDRGSAQRALADLEAAGVARSQVCVVAADSGPHEAPTAQHFARTTVGAIGGSLILGSIGAVIGWLAALLWPTHTVTSVTYAMVFIACVGGTIGWLAGGLAVRRVDIEREVLFREQAEHGTTVVAVNSGEREAEVKAILTRDGARDVPPVSYREAILPLFRSDGIVLAHGYCRASTSSLLKETKGTRRPQTEPTTERNTHGMLDNNDQLQGNLADQGDAPIVDGTPVYDAAGDKVGDVVEHNDEGGYMTLQKGWLFPKDVYVPYSAIQRKTTDGINLNMTKDQLQDQNWDNPPGLAGDHRDTNADYDTSRSGVMGVGTMATDTSGLAGTGRRDTTGTTERDVNVSVREEELTASKVPQEAGRVHVNRDVFEDQQTLNVPVQGDAGNPDADVFTDQDLDVPLMGEQVKMGKQPRANEELRLHKRSETENQPDPDTVRNERVNVGGVDDQGNMPLDNRNAGYSSDSNNNDDTTQVNRP
jgi:stress response protein YsnF